MSRDDDALRPRESGKPAPGRDSDARSSPEADVVDRADYDPAYDAGAPVSCEVCGGVMVYTAACKLRCPGCGYTRDCSDP